MNTEGNPMTPSKWRKEVMDERVGMAVQQLLDELDNWVHATGRHVTLFLVPLAGDERVVVAHDGKPVEDPPSLTPEQYFANAMAARRPR